MKVTHSIYKGLDRFSFISLYYVYMLKMVIQWGGGLVRKTVEHFLKRSIGYTVMLVCLNKAQRQLTFKFVRRSMTKSLRLEISLTLSREANKCGNVSGFSP